MKYTVCKVMRSEAILLDILLSHLGHEACILDPKTMEEPLWLEGKVLISRSPTIHPGDAQFATAIGKPPVGSIFERQALPNVLIFSTRGAQYELMSCA